MSGLHTMAVFTVRETKRYDSGTIILNGFWSAPGEAQPGALVWLLKMDPPDPGCILGVSAKAEPARDRKSGQPEPYRRRITSAAHLILIHRPEMPYEDGPPEDDGEIPF